MNHIYRSIWNSTTGTCVATSELASAKGQAASATSASCEGRIQTFRCKKFAVAVMLACSPLAQAAPTGGVITAGSVSVGGTASQMTVTQTTARAAINWQSFGIKAGESVKFIQPSSNSVALNRVIGPDASVILGRLSSNGQVFLVNPNGILFGAGASVNVGGLVASSLGISDADFMAGHYRFNGAGTGTVVNQGNLRAADGGYVALLGGSVNNQGVVVAQLGTIALAAGNAMTLDVSGDQLLNVAIDQGVANALVANGGWLQADGGKVLMTTQVAGNLLTNAVNNTGVVQARTLENHNGTILLLGSMDAGTVSVGGTLDVSGGTGLTGGHVVATGYHVGLFNAQINASGDAGGGTVLVGGDFQGQNPAVPHASAVYMSADSAIHADANVQGNGGRVVLWSDNSTRAHGNISSRGGALGGNGGMIETSGHWLDVSGLRVDTRAEHGHTGTWLLDPTDVTISADTTSEATETDGVFSPNLGVDKANVNVDDLVKSLDKTNVTVTTTNTKESGRGLGDISVDAAITWTTPTTLTLNAANDVKVKEAITATNGSLSVNAGHDVTVSAAVTTTTGNLTFTAAQDVNLDAANTITTGNLSAIAGRHVNVSAASTVTNGDMFFRADNNGYGPGAGAGTVTITCAKSCLTITIGALHIRFNPVQYANTADEIKVYKEKLTAGGTLDAKAWVFGLGENKTYDGLTNASVMGLKLDVKESAPPVSLGEVRIANFDTQHVGSAKPITFETRFSDGTYDLFSALGSPADTYQARADVLVRPLTVSAVTQTRLYNGNTLSSGTPTVDGLQFGDTLNGSLTQTYASKNALGAGASILLPNGAYTVGDGNGGSNYNIGVVNAAGTITPTALTVTARNSTKVYGQTPALTGFTTSGLVNTETVGSVTQTSTGQISTAGVSGSPYAVTPSAATGGTFTAGNYAISYVNGALTVTPVPLTITAQDVTKVYGETPALTGFSTSALMNGETVGSTTQTSTGQIATANVAGGPYAVVSSNATGGTFVPGNYAISYVNGRLTVTPAPLTITAQDVTKVYGQTPALTGFSTSLLVNGETVGSTTQTSTGQISTANVAGGPYLVTPSGATGGTFATDNYAISYVNGALTVTPAPLTITAQDVTKVYGQTPALTGFSTSSLVNGETVGSTTQTSTGQIATANVAGGPYAVTPSAATGGTFTPGNYAISYVNGALTVTPAALTISAQDVSKVYGQTPALSGFTTSALMNGETVGSTTQTSIGQIATANVDGGPYAVVPSNATGGTFAPRNYAISYVNGALTVTLAPLSITAQDVTKVYGQTPALTGFTTSALMNGETVGSTTQTSTGQLATANVAGGPYVVTPGNAAGGTFAPGNYAISYVNGALTVTPAPLTITAQDVTKVYGQTPALTGFSTSALMNGETVGSTTQTSTGQLATANVAGGPYAVTPSAATGGTFTAGNYAIGYVNGALAVTPAPLTITAQDVTKVYGQTPALTGFSTSALVNGETVGSATQISTGQIATASVAGGPYAVVSSNATGGTFVPGNYAISYVNGALTITPAPLTITAQDVTKVYGQTPALTGFSTSVLMNSETVGSTTQTSTGQIATATVVGGPYLVTPSNATGGTFTAGNYAIGYVNAALTVTPAPLTITAQDVTKVYGQTPALTGFTTSLLVNGETVGSTTQTSTGQISTANVAGGPYAVAPSNATGGTFAPANYAISYVNGTLTVTPAPLTITAQDVTKVYGQTPALTDFSTSALMNGETVGSTNQTSTGQLATANVAGGPYAVTPSGATGGTFAPENYAISYVKGALTVTPAPLTITAQDVTKVYGQTPTLTGFSTSALMNGETVGSTTQTSTGQLATANVAGGPYAVTPSSATGGTFTPGNYTISYVNGALTVTPAPLTITAQDVTKVYGQTPALTGFTTSALMNGEKVGGTTQTSTGQISTAGVSDGPYVVTASNATGGTFAPANYAISYVNGALTITPAPLTITAQDVTKVYGQTPALTGFSTSALMNGETVGSTTQTSTGQLATANVAGGPYAVTPSAATGGTFTASNYVISYVNGALTVTPAPLTITAQDVTKVYGQTPTLTGFTTSPLVNGETVGRTTQTSTGQIATANVASGPYLVTPSAATGGTFTAGNYAISYVNGALSVTPAPLTITAQDVTKVYGQTPALTGFTTSTLMNGETVGSTTQTSTGQLATANVAGGPYTVTPSNATGGTFTAGNYAIGYANGALTVTPAPLTITAQDVTKVYGQMPALTGFSTSALVNGETLGSTTQTSTGQLATANVAGGPYAVTPSAATGGTFTAGNYVISYVNGALSVTPAPLTITAQDVTKVYGQTPALTGFTTYALLNGETVGSTTQTSIGQIATANVAGGPYAVAPSNATGGTFTAGNYAISYVNGALTVSPAPLTITAQDVTKVYGQRPVLKGFSTSALMNGETVGSTTQTSTGQLATANVAGGPYAVTPSAATGGTFTAGNYVISYVNGTLTVTPAPLTITAQDVTKVYGQTPALTGFSTSALMNRETVGSTTQTSSGQIATANVAGGPYDVTPSNATGGTFAPGNYVISYLNGALTITPAPLTITAQDVTKVYGQTPTLTGFTTTPLVNGESVGSVTLSSTGQIANANVIDRPYAITPSHATGGTFTETNYAISYTNGALTVLPAEVVPPPIPPPVVDPTPDPSDTTPQRVIPAFSATQALPEMPTTDTNPLLLNVQPLVAITQGPVIFPAAPVLMPEPTLVQVAPLPAPPLPILPILPVLPPKQDRN